MDHVTADKGTSCSRGGGGGGAYFRFTNSFSSESLILYFAGDN